MKTRRRGELVPTSQAAIVARRTLGLRTTGRKRNIMRECTAQMRGSIPALRRFPGRLLVWQAPLEKRFLRMCVLSPLVVDAEAQPEGFYISESDHPQAADFECYPDATVAVRSGDGSVRPVVVECKPSAFAKAPEVAARLARIHKVLARSFLDYVVLTEHQLPDSLDSNLDLLFRAKRVPLPINFTLAVDDAMERTDGVPLGVLAERLGRNLVLSAIGQCRLHADLWSPLNDDSLVFVHAQEGHDVTRIL